MPTAKQLICRTHPGGKFTPPKRKGRPPVRCEEAYPCSARDTAITPPTHKPKSVAGKQLVSVGTDEGPTAARTRIQANFNGADASREKAKQAKALLVEQGWTVEGKGKGTVAEITAIRGTEMLFMAWDNGALTASNYSLWANNRKRHPSMPDPEFQDGFDPNMMSDRELVHALSGMTVTWWNHLGQSRMTAVVSNKRISIQQLYDEDAIKHGADPADRIISFVDMNGTGFRALRVRELLKIG